MTATEITQTGYSQGFDTFLKQWTHFFFVLQGTFRVLKTGAI